MSDTAAIAATDCQSMHRSTKRYALKTCNLGVSMAPAQKISVLLVEDSPVQSAAIAIALKETGHTVKTASDGEEALLVLGDQQPDIVLTDLNMPGLSGLDLLKISRKQFPDLPVILMTGDGNQDVAAEALRHGAASYVAKDKSMGALLETIDRIVASSSSAHSFGYLLDNIQRCQYSFILNNDRALVVSLVHYVQHLASRVGLVDPQELRNLGTATEEALLNAMYHGSLEVPDELREMEPDARSAFVEVRRRQEPYASRRIQIDIETSKDAIELLVRDEGPGFNHKQRFSKLNVNEGTVSIPKDMRGLVLMHVFLDEVEFRGCGNEVRLLKRLHASEE